MLARLAEIEEVRILFIKGPTAVLMGARPPRPSSDVDVLCEPGGMEKLGAALEACGWRRRVPESAKPHFVYAAKYLFEHSVHYIHDEWPCDLDIHYNFPGFWPRTRWCSRRSEEAGAVRRSPTGRCRAPTSSARRRLSACTASAIQGLHHIRADWTSSRMPSAGLSTSSWRNSRRWLLTLEFRDTHGPFGAVWALRHSQSVVRPREATTLAIADLRMPGTPTTSWLIELDKTPWLRNNPRLIRRALFLPSDELLSLARRPGTDSEQRCPTAGQALEPRVAPPAAGARARWRTGDGHERPTQPTKSGAAPPDVAFVDDGERVVLLDLRDPANSRPQLLTGTAAAIWRLIDESRPTAHIVGAVSSGPAGNAEEDVERDVVAFLGKS